jgi:holin-like protein
VRIWEYIAIAIDEVLTMLRGIGLLLGFQLAGELMVWALNLPVSGPLCGMAALLAWLCWAGGIPDDLAKVADGLLSNMAILFVPVGAGAIVYADLFRTRWPAIVTALVFATFITIAVTALTARWMGRLSASVHTSRRDQADRRRFAR